MGVISRWLGQGQGVGAAANASDAALNTLGKPTVPKSPVDQFEGILPRLPIQTTVGTQPKAASDEAQYLRVAQESQTRSAGLGFRCAAAREL
ncbi:MAG: hypothetical protein FWG75_10715 [Cystobacterineae bacterium]|nr:hypothetical protein [Cystobacterineae bacterium]